MEYASNAKANTGVTLGAVGTGLSALTALGGMGSIAGLFGNRAAAFDAVEDRCVTRHEMDLIREIMSKDQQIAIKDSEAYTDRKLVEVYTALANSDKAIRAEIAANLKEQNAINTEQAVYNAANNSTIGCLRSQVAALLGMTKMVIPSDNVCPKPMPEYNSWTAPT